MFREFRDVESLSRGTLQQNTVLLSCAGTSRCSSSTPLLLLHHSISFTPQTVMALAGNQLARSLAQIFSPRSWRVPFPSSIWTKLAETNRECRPTVPPFCTFSLKCLAYSFSYISSYIVIHNYCTWHMWHFIFQIKAEHSGLDAWRMDSRCTLVMISDAHLTM